MTAVKEHLGLSAAEGHEHPIPLSRRALLAGGLLLTSVGLAGCWRRSYAWNQKLKVTVQTPDGEVSAAAVSHMQVMIGTMPMTGNDQSNTFQGEATVLEVKPGQFLFALVGEESKWLAWKAWQSSLPLKSKDKTYAEIEQKRETITLPPALYPLLVTFTDINDPKSVVEVKPGELDKHFGEGVSLTSISLEITDDPVTEGAMEKVIPWLNEYASNSWQLNGKRCTACPDDGTFAESIGTGSLQTRVSK